MSYLVRINLVLITLLYLTPSALIEILNARSVATAAFLLSCATLFSISIAALKKPKGFSVFEKAIGATGLLITLISAFQNAINDTLYLEGYKFSLAFLFIFFGREISRSVEASDVFSDLTKVFGIYTAILLIFLFATGTDELIRSVGKGETYTRLDITGSVTVMAVSSSISMLLAISMTTASKGLTTRSIFICVAAAAAYLLILSASRQAILIALLYASLHFLSGRILAKKAAARRAIILVTAISSALALFAYTKFLNPSLYIRLFENPSEDYTSGRISSISQWLHEMNEKGGPLGFGHIRNNTIQEIELLWPHNEFFRFYIEGGALGILITIFFLVYSLSVLRLAMKTRKPAIAKNIVLLVFSVFIVQMSLENFMNNSFLSSICFIFLSNGAHSLLTSAASSLKPITKDQS